jgi:hypothetical protein
MSLEKLGAVKNLLDGFVYSEYNARANQGVAIAPELARDVMAQAHLNGTAKVAAPRSNGSAVVAVESGAAALAALIVDNSGGSDAWLQVFDTTSPTLGTTSPVVELRVDAGKSRAVILAEPIAMAALAWDATTAAKGGTRATAGTVKVTLAYFV